MSELKNLKGRKVLVHDMALRDGMHAKREQISTEQMIKVATALDDAGVPLIQVSHGAGLGGNSLQHGFAMHSNEEYWDAVVPKMKRAKISCLLIPGLGTMKELQSAYDHGVRSVDVRVSGPGSGRESAVRALASAGIEVRSIKDTTPIPHNGCRPPKRRRV